MASNTPQALRAVSQASHLVSSKVHSTPGNPGSGATTPGLAKFNAEDVRRLLWIDVVNFRVGSFERYLHYVLFSVGAVSSDPTGETRLEEATIRNELQGCLDAIDAAITQGAELKSIMDSVHVALKDYAMTSGETDRYKHFVKASNRILSLLRTINIAASRTPDTSLQFMRNDPRMLKSEHNGASYMRKPDIILTQSKYTDKLYRVRKADLSHLEEAPPKGMALKWDQGLMFLEFKKTEKNLRSPSVWSTVLPSQEAPARLATKQELETAIQPKPKVKTEGTTTQQSPLTSDVVSQSAAARNKRPRSDSDAGIDSQAEKRTKLDNSDKLATSDAEPVKPIVETEAPAAAAQLGEYAAEALYNSFGRNHALGLLVDDANINVWHFDHEFPIQMTGFDFLKTPQYLVLFLFALQRFTSEQWGTLDDFVEMKDNQSFSVDLTAIWEGEKVDRQDVKFTGKKDDITKPRYGLNGRGTGVLYGTVGAPDSGNQQRVAIKLSWAEKSRNQEKEFIDRAKEAFHDITVENPCDYLPTILAAKEYPQFQTAPIRRAVLTDEALDNYPCKANRLPRLVAMPQYQPITTLTTDWNKFLVAFFALFYCHAMLWSVGIRHGDISETNMMYDPITDKPKLCDFDLSHFRRDDDTTSDEPTGFSNTGTWIFMASELLTLLAMEGMVKRVYRHEVEAFIAVLIWIVCRYDGGKLRANPPLDHWNQTTFAGCNIQRQHTYENIKGLAKTTMAKPSGSPQDLWDAIHDTLWASFVYMSDRNGAYGRQVTYEKSGVEALRPQIHPDNYDTLLSLHMILNWPLFKLPYSSNFVKLLKERVARPPAT